MEKSGGDSSKKYTPTKKLDLYVKDGQNKEDDLVNTENVNLCDKK